MNMKYLLACGVAAVSIGTAMADPKPTVFPHGIAGSANVMTSAGAVQGTLSDAVTKAQGSVQQSTANQPNGYAKPDASGNVTLPVTGSVAAAPADASGDTVSTIAATAKSGSALAATAVQKTQVGAANGVAPLDGQTMMSAAVSGNLDNGITTSTNPRTLANRNLDIPDLNDTVLAWDGSTTFKENINSYFNSGVRYVAPLPCNAALPTPDSNGFADIGGATGKFFIDVCGAQRVGGGYYNYVDYALGNNNPTMTAWGGELFVNRYNSGAVNSNGLMSVNMTQATTTQPTQWPGGIDPDMPAYGVRVTMPEYGPDGKQTTGSPLGFFSKVDNYSHRNWAVQAQGMKIWCINHTVGGSCWGYSTNINDISGRSAQPWNLINENDSQSNGPENPAAFYNPKLSYRQMDYASAVAQVPNGYATNTQYSVGAQVLVNDSKGNARILIASIAGTSGTTALVSPTTEGSTIKDGTVTWTVGTTRDTTIGVVHWINRDADGSPSSEASYNFGFSGNALMNNSMFDASHAIYGPKAAPFRMAPDTSFSMCDPRTATSDADLNNCTLTWNGMYKEYVLQAFGRQLIVANQDGTVSVNRLYSDGGGFTTDGSGAVKLNKLTAGNVTVEASLYLGVMSKASILALSSPVEGQKVFDSDDHEEVTYRCPTTTTCGWYPVQYGAALSN